MSTEQQALADPQQFHHCDREGAACECPIHRGRDREPFTAPLGLPFASHVRVDPLTREQAADVYAAHHGYMDSVPNVNLAHHGLTYQRSLVGAITYRYPLLSRKRLYLGTDGTPIPEPMAAEDVRRALPEALHRTALETLALDRSDDCDVAETRVVSGDRFVEAARICLGVRMANLASASLACSQERFVRSNVCEPDVEYLLTFVRSDYDATMVRALRDKGWTCVGWTDPKQPGNRETRPIHERYKWTFLCPVETVEEQADLSRWSA